MTKMEQLNDFLGGPPQCFYLSTIDGDKPRCRPLGLHHLYKDQIYYGVGDFKEVYRQLLANPAAEVVACKGMKWVRINGRVVFEDQDAPVVKEIYENFMLRKHYEEKGWTLKIFHFEDAEVQYIDMMTVTETFHID